jgi:acyl-homoserine lactone acylase PvdQ
MSVLNHTVSVVYVRHRRKFTVPWRTREKFTLTLCLPTLWKRHNCCTRIALVSVIMLAVGCLRVPAQAAQANAPLKLQPGQVTIFRDRWGMAHLYAAREEDGFFGLRYAKAEDRLDQVLLLYLAAKGELAAAFGTGQIGADKVGPMHGGEIPDTPYTINVRGAAPVTSEFEYTRHNGVLSPVVERRGDDAFVVSSAYFDQVGMRNAELFGMAHARTHVDIEAALAPMDLYPANLILAGRDGTLLYIRPGRLPKRPDGVDVTLPLDGSTSRTAWTGFVSLNEAVQVENPPQDYVGNDNVSSDRMYATPILDPQKYPAYHRFDLGQTNTRQLRMIELLENAHGVSNEAAIQITMYEKVFGTDQWGGMLKTLRLSGAWAKNTDPDLTTFVAALESFDGVFAKESRGALYNMAFREALRSASHKAAGEIEGAVEARRTLSPVQQRSVEDAVLAAYDTLRQGFGTINLVFGDVHRIGRGSDSFPVGGAAIDSSQDKKELNTIGAWVLEPSGAEAMRTMAFHPDVKKPTMLDAYCCQRAPFVVALHPDGSLTAYSEMLPGVSEDPASPHFGDQMRLASQAELRPDYFYLRDLERNTESRIDMLVTGASAPIAKAR